MVEIGTQAPDFTLPDQDGNLVSLSDLRGQNVVVYFYPKADARANKTHTRNRHRAGGYVRFLTRSGDPREAYRAGAREQWAVFDDGMLSSRELA